MNISIKKNEQITQLLNDWYIEIRARHVINAQRLKEEIDTKIHDIQEDKNLLLYYSLLDFRHQYIINNLGVSKDSFDKVESLEIPTNSPLTYYYHFFKAIHDSGIGNYMIAKGHFEKAESLLELIPDEIEKAEFYYKLGAFHFDTCEALQSFKYTTKAKEMFSQHTNHERNIGFCENLLGMACIKLKEWALAEEHLINAMSIFQKVEEEKYILMVRHNLGFMYSSQNLSTLAVRYLSEVTSKNPRHIKALYLEAKERYKLNELAIAEELADNGYNICCELGNKQYKYHFSILRSLIKNIELEDFERIVLEANSYFEGERLYEYVNESLEELAARFHLESNPVKASEYFYLGLQARKKAFDKEALK